MKGEFLTYYTAELISDDEAAKRESQYTESDGSYMYFFKHGRKMLWFVTHATLIFIFVFLYWISRL